MAAWMVATPSRSSEPPWLLPPLLAVLANRAPHVRLVRLPVQFRTVEQALATRSIDLAVTVADALPSSILRAPLLTCGFVCLFDPRQVPLKQRLSEREYFARQHVIVSYNGDLRGIIEDLFRKERDVRCAVSSFSHVGSVIMGSKLLATVPTVVAQHLLALHPKLATAQLPFAMDGAHIELLWPLSVDDDEACRFVREQLIEIAANFSSRAERQTAPGARNRNARTR